MYRNTSRRFTKNGDIIRVSSECSYVLLHPLECSDLVHVSITTLGFLWMFSGEGRKCEMPQSSEAIIEVYQNNTLPGKLRPPGFRIGTATANKSTTIYPDHNGKLVTFFCSRGTP